MLNLLISLTVLFILFIMICIYESLKKKKLNKKEEMKEYEKKYVLNVVTIDEDGGVSSHWHGWSSKWLFTHEKALKEKERIKHLFDEVEILEHETEQKEIKEHIEKAFKESK